MDQVELAELRTAFRYHEEKLAALIESNEKSTETMAAAVKQIAALDKNLALLAQNLQSFNQITHRLDSLEQHIEKVETTAKEAHGLAWKAAAAIAALVTGGVQGVQSLWQLISGNGGS